MSVTNSWRTFFSDPARDSPEGVRVTKRGEELFLTRTEARAMKPRGPGLRHEREAPASTAPSVPSEPEDGDWEPSAWSASPTAMTTWIGSPTGRRATRGGAARDDPDALKRKTLRAFRPSGF